ncbi:helix-turn-helix domain-containing protein [Candidatus Poriferisodalis sp.]
MLRELAEMDGKSQSAISQIEHGQIGLSLALTRLWIHLDDGAGP